MTPIHPEDDGVDGLLDQAEVMLSLAERPESTSDRLAYALAASNIALVRTLRAQYPISTPTNRAGLVELYPELAVPMPYPLPEKHISTSARKKLVEDGVEWPRLVEAVRHLVRTVGIDPNKRVIAIKNLRQIVYDHFRVTLSLIAAKEIIDHCVSRPGWWDSPV